MKGGLSAKASEFVPGGSTTFPGMSPKATEYVPEGNGHWGWNGSTYTNMSGNGNAWGGAQPEWGYYNSYDAAWQRGVGAQGCLFNEDAYSTDSSRSSSEPEEEDQDIDDLVPKGVGADAAVQETSPAVASDSESDSDEFNSFSEDEPEIEESKEGAREGIQRSAASEEGRSLNPEVPDTSSCKYDVALMLRIRQAVGVAPDHEPRWSTQADQEQTPDWLRRRAKEEESTGHEWRSRTGDAKSRRSQDKQDKKEKEPSEAPPKLEVSETSWAAQLAKRKVEKEKESSEGFVKSMRSILNKLTVEKFETLSDQIVELIAQSREPSSGIPLLMQLIFEKATTQHHFINMYVSLCVKLHKWLIENLDLAESQSNFKRVLLNQCQTSFEQYLEPPEGFEGLTGDELYEAQVKYKTKMLGNIRLVGELIRHGMLAPKIAIAVASELAGDDPAVRGERLETLATFLETVGVALDDPSWKHHSELELVFSEVERASSDKSVPRRVRCLLQDVLDLRREGWKSQRRKDLSKETPQTLAQVHEQARVDQTPSRREIARSGSYR